MKKIRLPKGKFCLVDDEDYDFLNKISWHIDSHMYAYRKTSGGIVKMHRFIMRKELKDNPDMEIDHINNNRLDNRRGNLRLCTRQQNVWNTSKREDTASKYIGVSLTKNNKWVAGIGEGGKRKHLGVFDTEIEAAKAYNKKALELRGEFAKLNEIEE